MRTPLFIAVCAILLGCSSPMPPQQVCTSQSCFSRTAATRPIHSKRTAFRPKPTKTVAKSKKAAKSTKLTAAKPLKETSPVEEKTKSGVVLESDVPPSAQPSLPPKDGLLDKAAPGIAAKKDIPESGQPAEPSDPVLEKAKVAVAAKMENPASAEFADVRRPTRKTPSGQSEVICGQVKGKKKSGEPTGEKPFLYLVHEDEAYIVEGSPESMVAIVYRAQCYTPNSP